ncbi:MAG: penicillin acylase family protein [Thermoleophilaceae bacterium]|nr:penicillin acylase family protein [Thermoleophilaceae bacterium]
MRSPLAPLIAAMLLLPAAASAAPVQNLPREGSYDVAVRTTSFGVPHILAKDYGSMGYGYGYNFARENICTIASSYVTVSAERARFFGAEKTWTFEGNGSVVNNLNSDFYFQRIKDTQTVEKLLAQAPPKGPRPEIKEGVTGYVAGYNRYLRDTGVANLPDPTCKGQPWVREITEIDVYRYFYKLALLASGGVVIDGVAGAAPPTPAVAPSAGPTTAEQEKMVRENQDRFTLAAGSNAYGLGKEATSDGKGLVLGNPHFPWMGSQRLYQSHLTIPGKVDVTGGSLYGVPIVLIGHTKGLGWSHTVSTARRFALFDVKLVPGSPTSYILDGQVRQMKADKVSVTVAPSDVRTRTLYSTVHGPITTSLLGLPLFPWTSASATAFGDANAQNFRYLNHFFETNQAQSVRELDAVERRNQGIPWVNTIAADSKGEAYYADIGAVPHVTNDKAERCNNALGRATFALLGVAILDGSQSSCDFGNDPDALQPGTLGPSRQPSLFRNDYVTNSNDSYWLSNPKQPLEGFPRIMGDERTQRSLRTRSGLVMVEERLAGKDGRPGNKFDLANLQEAVFANRQHAGELFRDDLVAYCKANPVLTGASGPVNVSEACPILEKWDLRDNLDSNGAVLFRRFAAKVVPNPASGAIGNNPALFSDDFNANDAVNTPRKLNTGNPQVGQALADAVAELRSNSIPLDARLREYQTETIAGEKIPIHGGPGTLGVFNAISNPFKGRSGFPDVGSGSSFVMAAHLNGTDCPDSRSIVTYSQSANPSSPHAKDMTKLFSEKKWVDMRFCTEEVLTDPELSVTELGCLPTGGLKGVSVKRRGKRVRLGFGSEVKLPATIEVFSVGRDGKRRRVAKVSSAKPVLSRAARRSGRYIARFSLTGKTGRLDVREVGFTVRGKRLKRARPHVRAAGCGFIREARLSSSAFGGRRAVPLGISARTAVPTRMTVRLLRGRKVVKTVRAKPGRGARISAKGVKRGNYKVRISVSAGKQKGSVTLNAARI